MNKIRFVCFVALAFTRASFALTLNALDPAAAHFATEPPLIAVAEGPFTAPTADPSLFGTATSFNGSPAIVFKDSFSLSRQDESISPTRHGKILFTLAIVLGIAMIVVDRFLRRSSPPSATRTNENSVSAPDRNQTG